MGVSYDHITSRTANSTYSGHPMQFTAFPSKLNQTTIAESDDPNETLSGRWYVPLHWGSLCSDTEVQKSNTCQLYWWIPSLAAQDRYKTHSLLVMAFTTRQLLIVRQHCSLPILRVSPSGSTRQWSQGMNLTRDRKYLCYGYYTYMTRVFHPRRDYPPVLTLYLRISIIQHWANSRLRRGIISLFIQHCYDP